jgi:hypothetical protein
MTIEKAPAHFDSSTRRSSLAAAISVFRENRSRLQDNLRDLNSIPALGRSCFLVL